MSQVQGSRHRGGQPSSWACRDVLEETKWGTNDSFNFLLLFLIMGGGRRLQIWAVHQSVMRQLMWMLLRSNYNLCFSLGLPSMKGKDLKIGPFASGPAVPMNPCVWLVFSWCWRCDCHWWRQKPVPGPTLNSSLSCSRSLLGSLLKQFLSLARYL